MSILPTKSFARLDADRHRAFAERLAAIPWADYKTAYGNAAGEHWFEKASKERTDRWGPIPEQLTALASSDSAVAMAASHHLWSCLCHQHAYVSSAALPALPFILEILDNASEQLTAEILDILTGFAMCSRDRGAEGEDWIRELRRQLLLERPRFEQLARHSNEHIADWASNVLEGLGLAT